VQDPATNNVFAVIRIPQSLSTPHIVDDKTVYVRTGQSKHPEDLIDPTRLQWIHNLRTSAEELRRGLVNQVYSRRNNFLRLQHMLENYIAKEPKPTVPFWQFIAIPVFPEAPLFTLPDLKGVLASIATKTNQHEEVIGTTNLRTVPQGLQWGSAIPFEPYRLDKHAFSGVKGRFEYGELNYYGALYRACSFDDPDAISLQVIERELAALYRSAIKLYEFVGYFGPVEIACSFQNMFEAKAVQHSTRTRGVPKTLISHSFEYIDRMPVNAFSERLKGSIIAAARQIAWSLDIQQLDEQQIEVDAE
jgi:hypothetical protein